MKKSPTNTSRGKPPSSIRTPYLGSKSRTHLNVDRLPFHLPPSPLGSERLMSMSETPEILDVPETSFNFSSKEVNDCMTQWLAFLKVLKTLCVAGSELTDSIMSLSMGPSPCKEKGPYLKAMWEHLICATNNAAAIIRNQTVASLQEVVIAPDIDPDQSETNQQVMCSGLIRLVNVQYQVSVACCEWLGGAGWCPCGGTAPEWDAVARCFTTPRPPSGPQRRWSEAVPHTAPDHAGLRRWSVPWKLALPTSGSADKSRSTTPDAGWHSSLPSQEELQDVISLLSCRPANSNNPPLPAQRVEPNMNSVAEDGVKLKPVQQPPQQASFDGVVLTRATDCQHPENVSSRSMMPRGSWMSDCSDDMLDPVTLSFRKSSSSTDSSSCYSIHSRSTSGSEELSHSQHSHLYSMWSGSDLPFIKLPESTESHDPT